MGSRSRVRGVTLFEIRDGLIVAGTLYVEEIELDSGGNRRRGRGYVGDPS